MHTQYKYGQKQPIMTGATSGGLNYMYNESQFAIFSSLFIHYAEAADTIARPRKTARGKPVNLIAIVGVPQPCFSPH